jgi:hypothetical protein
LQPVAAKGTVKLSASAATALRLFQFKVFIGLVFIDLVFISLGAS